ncbi:MAG: hypothetical protein AAF664_01010 [Planctomycetota bacterium]
MSNSRIQRNNVPNDDRSWDHWLQSAESGDLEEHQWRQLADRLSVPETTASSNPISIAETTNQHPKEHKLEVLIDRFGEPPPTLIEIWAEDLALQSGQEHDESSDDKEPAYHIAQLRRAFHETPESFAVNQSGVLVRKHLPALQSPKPTPAAVRDLNQPRPKAPSSKPKYILAGAAAIMILGVAAKLTFWTETESSSASLASSDTSSAIRPREQNMIDTDLDQAGDLSLELNEEISPGSLEPQSDERANAVLDDLKGSIGQSSIDSRTFTLDTVSASKPGEDETELVTDVDPMAIFAGYSQSLPDPNTAPDSEGSNPSLKANTELALNPNADPDGGDSPASLGPAGFAAEVADDSDPEVQEIAVTEDDDQVNSIDISRLDESLTIGLGDYLLSGVSSPIRSGGEEPFSLRKINEKTHAIELSKSAVAVARLRIESLAGENILRWQWDEQNIRAADIQTLKQSRLRTKINDSVRSIYLRQVIHADAFPLSLDQPNLAASWNLLVPPAVLLPTNWKVRFETADEIEVTWTTPLAMEKPRTAVGEAVYRLTDNEHVALRLNLDFQLSRQLEMRVRFQAKLDSRMDYLPVSTQSVDRFADQLQAAIASANREKERLEDVYRIAGNQRNYIRAKQKRNDLYIDQLSLIDERTVALQTLLSLFDGSPMHLTFASEWPEGEKQEILRVGNVDEN